MPSIAESLKQAETILEASGIAGPRREAITLLMAAAKKEKAFLYAHPEYILQSDESRRFDSFVQRRSNREPIQYITGVQEFYGLEFEVTPDVLIPRPETEMLVERAIDLLRSAAHPNFCEVGVGSGCISISILHQLQHASATGLEISDGALAVAGRNAEKHSVTERLELLNSDLFGSIGELKFDMIVSNPPYVPAVDIDGLQAEVRDFEPHLALTDGGEGLSILQRIVHEAPKFLRPTGHLLLEIGIDQATQVAEMFDPSIWAAPEFSLDLQGIPRVVCARLI